MNFRKLLCLLSLSSAAFGHNVSTFATDLAPHVSLSSCGTATIQVIALLQDLKLAFLQAASNLTWEDDSSGRAQDALRQVHSREMVYSRELHDIVDDLPTCNFTITPASVDEYLNLGRMLVSLVTGNLVHASSTIAHTDIELLPLLSSLIAVNSHYLLDPDVADPVPLLTPVTDIWAYNAALSFAQYGSCKNNPSLPILGRLQTAADNADASFQQFSWNAASEPFLLEKGKQLYIAWVHQFHPPLYTALNVTGEGIGRARVPQSLNGSFVMAGITTEMVEDIDALSLATLAGPVVLDL